jgi:hypothetical protein
LQVKKNIYFTNDYLVGVKTERMKNLRVKGGRIKAWSILSPAPSRINVVSKVTPMFLSKIIIKHIVKLGAQYCWSQCLGGCDSLCLNSVLW